MTVFWFQQDFIQGKEIYHSPPPSKKKKNDGALSSWDGWQDVTIQLPTN